MGGRWGVATVLATFGELTAFWLLRRNVGNSADFGHISKARNDLTLLLLNVCFGTLRQRLFRLSFNFFDAA